MTKPHTKEKDETQNDIHSQTASGGLDEGKVTSAAEQTDTDNKMIAIIRATPRKEGEDEPTYYARPQAALKDLVK
uniref:Uncharacterized protein n=1 Tax=candidate division WWE3 bacterium TaxID=2053526 RepID=A0A7C4TJI8_UNCKA